MNLIENYKKRFNMLMESTIGDVKPLIKEDNTKDDASLSYICNTVATYINGEIDKYRAKDPTFPNAKVEVVRTPTKTQGEDDATYSFKFNGTILSVKGLEGDTATNVKPYGNALKYSFDTTPESQYAPKLPKSLKKLPGLFGGIQRIVDPWVAGFQKVQPTKPQGTKPVAKTPTQPK